MHNPKTGLVSIIVAGGSGQRMHSQLPKQFMDLDGRPILIRTVEHYMNALTCLDVQNLAIVLVIPQPHIDLWQELSREYDLKPDNLHVVSGGSTRFESVLNGLNYYAHHILDSHNSNQSTLVSIHDGVRPFITPSIIKDAILSAQQYGSGIATTDVVDSLRLLSPDGTSSKPLVRSLARAIQTPQVFNFAELHNAYLSNSSNSDSFTDDASVIECNGSSIHLSQGAWFNIKVTNPADIATAEYILNHVYEQRSSSTQ